jgi:hypothetical protein
VFIRENAMIGGKVMLMRDRNDQETIRRDLHRWRNMLNAHLDPDTKRAVRVFINGATTRLREIGQRTNDDGHHPPKKVDALLRELEGWRDLLGRYDVAPGSRRTWSG